MSRRRRPAVILGALAAGAAINVAVAWGCALRTYIHVTIPMPEGSEPLPWPLKNDLGWPEPDRYVRSEGPGVSIVTVDHNFGLVAANKTDPSISGETMKVYRFGLPMRSMLVGAAFTFNVNTYAQVPMGWYTEGLAGPQWDRSRGLRRRIPMRPDWPGFVVDTAVYAGGLLLLGAIPGRVRGWRRARRMRRGACPVCGYEAISIAGCPECGEAAQP
jgi:hypothetical protein